MLTREGPQARTTRSPRRRDGVLHPGRPRRRSVRSTAPPVDELFARLHESETVSSRRPRQPIARPRPARARPLPTRSSRAPRAMAQRPSSPPPSSSPTRRARMPPAATAPSARSVPAAPKPMKAAATSTSTTSTTRPGKTSSLVSAGSATPHVQGVARISQDGSHVYFVAQGVLTGTPNSQGQTAQAGEENLYVFERDAAFPNGRTPFVATVASSDQDVLGGRTRTEIRGRRRRPPTVAFWSSRATAS